MGEERAKSKNACRPAVHSETPLLRSAQRAAWALPLAYQHPAHSGFPQDAVDTLMSDLYTTGSSEYVSHAPGQAVLFNPSYFHNSYTLHYL